MIDWKTTTVCCCANPVCLEKGCQLQAYQTFPSVDIKYVPVTVPDERDALRGEVAELRAEVERLRVLGPDTEARITVEAREIATVMLRPVVDSWRAEVERVRADERAAIVAWLRADLARCSGPVWGTLKYTADAIENGEHLKVEKGP